MKWQEFLESYGKLPIIHSSWLKVGKAPKGQLELQLSRWSRMGRILLLRRGCYVLAEAYRKVEPHPFVLANHLRQASYVSLQSALAWHGLIPEHVPQVTSITTGRPESLSTPLGGFVFRHFQAKSFYGFHSVLVAPDQEAFVAQPEKALIDLIALTPEGESADFLTELRLQNTEILSEETLKNLVTRWNKPKLKRALKGILALMATDREVQTL